MGPPEVVWDWVGLVRIELKNLGMALTNRERCSAILAGANVVKTHKPNHVILGHCLAIEYIGRLWPRGDETAQNEFGNGLRRMGEFLNTQDPGGAIWVIRRLRSDRNEFPKLRKSDYRLRK